MASYNKLIVMGNLTRDPAMKYVSEGMAITEFGLAVNERKKQPDGSYADEPIFVDVTLFGRSAEVANQYLKKGSPALVDGRLRMEKWVDKQTGQNRSKLSMVGEKLQLIGGRQDGQQQAAAPQPTQHTPVQPPAQNFSPSPPADSFPEDDIPF